MQVSLPPCLTYYHGLISSDTMKVLAMSRDIWVPRFYTVSGTIWGQGRMSWIS